MLRNLSWRADVNSKKTLREVGSVRALMGCALEVQKVSNGVHWRRHDCGQNNKCDLIMIRDVKLDFYRVERNYMSSRH